MNDCGDFLAGVATSGYQSEGGFNGTGEPQNNWAAHESSGRVARTGRAVDFWNRYESDFALCSEMGLNAFRMSIEWARVQPSTSPHEGRAPDFDFAAIDAYADRLAACIASGMEPVLTLQHFTHPAWLGVDAWLHDDTPAAFELYVRTVVERINERLVSGPAGRPLRWYVTLNEPNMLVLNTYLNRHFPGGKFVGIKVGLRAYNRLLAAHLRAYNAIHDLHESRGWPEPNVTMNTFCSDVYWSENLLLDVLSLRECRVSRREAVDYIHARSVQLRRALAVSKLPLRADFFAWFGRVIQHAADFIASRAATEDAFGFFLDEAERSKRDRALDFLGLDYYDPFFGHLFRPPTFADLEFKGNGSFHGRLMDGISSKWWDWHVLPGGLSFFCKYYAGAFPGRGILIAENGIAQRCTMDNSLCPTRRDRVLRSDFLREHFGEVTRLLEGGTPLLGYLHWSLTDNYEWGSFTPRFGLFRIDYAKNLSRLAVDQLGDNPSATYKRLLAEFRAGRQILSAA